MHPLTRDSGNAHTEQGSNCDPVLIGLTFYLQELTAAHHQPVHAAPSSDLADDSAE